MLDTVFNFNMYVLAIVSHLLANVALIGFCLFFAILPVGAWYCALDDQHRADQYPRPVEERTKFRAPRNWKIVTAVWMTIFLYFATPFWVKMAMSSIDELSSKYQKVRK